MGYVHLNMIYIERLHDMLGAIKTKKNVSSHDFSGAFGYDSNLGTCSILKDANGRSSKTALFVIAFIIPCIIIIGCYAKIFWVVHK